MDKILIKELRKSVKNQSEVAKKLGKKSTTINRMLSGKYDVGIGNLLEIGKQVGLSLKWIDIREPHIKAVGEELKRQFQTTEDRDKRFLIDVANDLDPLEVCLIYDNGWEVWHVESCAEDGKTTDVTDYWADKLDWYLMEMPFY